MNLLKKRYRRVILRSGRASQNSMLRGSDLLAIDSTITFGGLAAAPSSRRARSFGSRGSLRASRRIVARGTCSNVVAGFRRERALLAIS